MEPDKRLNVYCDAFCLYPGIFLSRKPGRNSWKNNKRIQGGITMKFTIKAGRKTSDNVLRMRMFSGKRLYFRFKLDRSCFYDNENIINGWNRICGVHFFGTKGSCDLVFTKDSDCLTLAMQVTYGTTTGIYKTSILKRLDVIIPGRWYRCEILHYKNPNGIWFYSIVVEAENDFYMPVSWQMNAPESTIPIMFLRHPTLGGRYSFNHDCDIDIERINQ